MSDCVAEQKTEFIIILSRQYAKKREKLSSDPVSNGKLPHQQKACV